MYKYIYQYEYFYIQNLLLFQDFNPKFMSFEGATTVYVDAEVNKSGAILSRIV